MADVFISYARTTEAKARQIADALRALGYGVWRDDELPAHRAYADVISERLRAARAVVVIWSTDAARSEWVRSEADRARTESKLVQLSLDGSAPPMPFDQIQCADLAGWNGETDAAGWRKVAASVAELVGGEAPPSGQVAPVPAPAAAPVRTGSICVLPFVNMSGDAEQEYFSDGISEDIITDLSKVAALFVVARNTAFTFKGKAVEVPHVARQLGVGHVLEGSVRKAGGRVRITAQLIDGATGGHVWAERWDRDLADIFALQDEISRMIVGALKLRLLPEKKTAVERRGTENAEAYDLYLMARQLRLSGDIGAPRRDEMIIRLCRQALDLDPKYSRAWTLMGAAQSSLRFSYGRRDIDGWSAIETALSLDPDLTEAHALKAQCLRHEGRQADAADEIETALRLDPESFEANKAAADLRFGEGRFAEAIPFFEKAVAALETGLVSPAMLITCYTATGDDEGARRVARLLLERAEAVLAEDSGNAFVLGFGVCALAVLGEADRARSWIRRARLVDPDDHNLNYNFACALSFYLKDIEGALELLGGFFEHATRPNLEHAKVDPDLDTVRQDARFKAMLAAAEARLGPIH